VAWEYGDALWNYRGGRPPLGSLLITGIKSGESGWRRSLLKRVSNALLPEWAKDVDLVTSAPSSLWHKWQRGFDLAEESARVMANNLDCPYEETLGKRLFAGPQAKKTESQRRRMPKKDIYIRKGVDVSGKTILLVDDVWTTGTTLLRCAELLKKTGAKEIRVLALFRAM
jgi:predicted amidophosphoribosyltransferase